MCLCAVGYCIIRFPAMSVCLLAPPAGSSAHHQHHQHDYQHRRVWQSVYSSSSFLHFRKSNLQDKLFKSIHGYMNISCFYPFDPLSILRLKRRQECGRMLNLYSSSSFVHLQKSNLQDKLFSSIYEEHTYSYISMFTCCI